MKDVNIYTCKDGRMRAYIKGTKKVISYPRLLLEEKLGRELQHREQVHHIDGDPLNNSLDNLELKMLGEHQREHTTKYFDKEMTCYLCGKRFVWTVEQQRRHYGNYAKSDRNSELIGHPFCSKHCVGVYGRNIQLEHAGVAK